MNMPKNLVLFGISTLVSGLLCTATSAQAALTARISPVEACMSQSGPQNSNMIGVGSGVRNNGLAIAVETMMCGFPNVDFYSVADLRVYVKPASATAMTAYACVRSLTSASGACGTQANTSGTAYQTMYPDHSYWTGSYSSYHAYVYVIMNGGDELIGMNTL